MIVSSYNIWHNSDDLRKSYAVIMLETYAVTLQDEFIIFQSLMLS